MELSGIAFGRRNHSELDRLLAAARSSELSYDHPGSTLENAGVPGGPGRSFWLDVDGDLGLAALALRRWEPHRGIRARIHPAGAPLEVGATLLVVAPLGPIEMAVPNRVVAVVDDPVRFGFAYGTLPGHAEAGEEAFIAKQTFPGHLRLTIRVHARPATTLARLGGPIVTLLQQSATRRYLSAWATAIRAATD